MSIVVYLLKVSLALLLCWALYWTAFRKLTFFQWNRLYLLASVVLSLILPLLRLQWKNTMMAGSIPGPLAELKASEPLFINLVRKTTSLQGVDTRTYLLIFDILFDNMKWSSPAGCNKVTWRP